MKLLALLAVVLGVSAPSRAGDREFDAIVRRVETYYATPPTRIPLFGLANLIVKVAHPAGATDLKLAIFEDMRRPAFTGGEEFTTLVSEALGPDWRPFVRVHSRRDREWTCIYSNASGNRLGLLIATLEQREATLVRVRLNTKALLDWVHDPVRQACGRHRHPQ